MRARQILEAESSSRKAFQAISRIPSKAKIQVGQTVSHEELNRPVYEGDSSWSIITSTLAFLKKIDPVAYEIERANEEVNQFLTTEDDSDFDPAGYMEEELFYEMRLYLPFFTYFGFNENEDGQLGCWPITTETAEDFFTDELAVQSGNQPDFNATKVEFIMVRQPGRDELWQRDKPQPLWVYTSAT
jgi:hypothetical protein